MSQASERRAPGPEGSADRGRTLWDLIAHAFRRPWFPLVAITVVALPLLLAALGVLELHMGSDGVHFSRGSGRGQSNGASAAPVVAAPVAATNGPRIDGTWAGQVKDIDYGEFRAIFTNAMDLTLTREGDTVIATGQFRTDSLKRGQFVGAATLNGRGTVSAGEYLRLEYSIANRDTRGFGVMLLQFAPNGKLADGYALYRRTNAINGRLGLGRATFVRTD